MRCFVRRLCCVSTQRVCVFLVGARSAGMCGRCIVCRRQRASEPGRLFVLNPLHLYVPCMQSGPWSATQGAIARLVCALLRCLCVCCSVACVCTALLFAYTLPRGLCVHCPGCKCRPSAVCQTQAGKHGCGVAGAGDVLVRCPDNCCMQAGVCDWAALLSLVSHLHSTVTLLSFRNWM